MRRNDLTQMSQITVSARPLHDAFCGREVGAEVVDVGASYRVVQVEQPPHERAFGHVWAEPVE